MTVAMFLLCLAAVARITRFVVADVLFQPVREFLDRRQGDRTIGLSTLVHCDFCASIWVSAAVFTTAYYADGADWFTWTAAGLGASYIYAVAASFLDSE